MAIDEPRFLERVAYNRHALGPAKKFGVEQREAEDDVLVRVQGTLLQGDMRVRNGDVEVAVGDGQVEVGSRFGNLRFLSRRSPKEDRSIACMLDVRC